MSKLLQGCQKINIPIFTIAYKIGIDGKVKHKGLNSFKYLFRHFFMMSDVPTESNLRDKLTPEEYEVCVNRGTERPFSGNLLYNKDKGIYSCKCCGAELFDSDQKYDSQSGWPSFWAPHNEKNITKKMDYELGMTRIEVICSKCGCHLGHVFEDGPKPTGLRYCINSLSLNFEKAK